MHRIARSFAPPLVALLLLLASTALAAGPRLVRVPLGGAVTMGALLEAGLDVVGVRGGTVELLEWPGDDATLARLGASATVLDADPGRTQAERARAELAARPRRASTRVWSATGPTACSAPRNCRRRAGAASAGTGRSPRSR
ncbi:MAG: hypothetical protein U0704_13015 [Candidatus Eisenbacteria bacterium]